MHASPRLTRRHLLATTAAAAATSAFPLTAVAAKKRKQPLLKVGGFDCGVASGFPGTNEITVWTHVADVGGDGYVKLEVATDPDFRHQVVRQNVRAAPVRDHTARAHLTGLQPGEQYFYRFATHHTHSPVGRFKTLRPADSQEPVRIAYFSCQDYQAGYYPSHAGIAAEDDLDLVVCLGDYIYEQTYYPGPRAGMDKTGGTYMTDDPAYVVTHDEFRAKYRLYKSDPNLQAMHAAHPYVSIWDDHEVEDNYAGTARDSAKTDPLPYDFATRRRNGYLAWFEYMPRLRSKPVDFRIYGTVPISNLVDFFLTDERQYRDPQPCDDREAAPCPDADKPRHFLGDTQKAWFIDAVTKSKATWKLVANELMIMSLDSVPGVPLNLDSWDGYAYERGQILTAFAQAGVKNLSFLTGDIHQFFAGTVTTTGRTGGTPVGTEFVGGSISSLGLDKSFGKAGAALVASGIPANNPHITYAELVHRGYAVMTASPDELRVDYRGPASNDSATSPVSTLASFQVANGSTQVQRTA